MNTFLPLITGIALSVGVSQHAQGQAESTNYERPDITEYRASVKSRIQDALEPLGLEVGGVRGKNLSTYQLGVPISDTGLNLGINITRDRGAYSPLMSQASATQVRYGISLLKTF